MSAPRKGRVAYPLLLPTWLVFSFNAARQTAMWDGFTLDWYRKLLSNDALLRSVRNSLLVAGITTVVAGTWGPAPSRRSGG